MHDASRSRVRSGTVWFGVKYLLPRVTFYSPLLPPLATPPCSLSLFLSPLPLFALVPLRLFPLTGSEHGLVFFRLPDVGRPQWLLEPSCIHLIYQRSTATSCMSALGRLYLASSACPEVHQSDTHGPALTTHVTRTQQHFCLCCCSSPQSLHVCHSPAEIAQQLGGHTTPAHRALGSFFAVLFHFSILVVIPLPPALIAITNTYRHRPGLPAPARGSRPQCLPTPRRPRRGTTCTGTITSSTAGTIATRLRFARRTT